MPRLASNSLPVTLSLALAGLTACGPKIRMSDNIDTELDLGPSQRYDDTLHGPYVAGASFDVYAYDISEDNALDGWTMVSLDPDVLEVVSVEILRDDLDDDDDKKAKTDIIVAHVEATGPGTATLEVHNHNDKFIRDTQIVIMQPDRAELRAAGPLFIGNEDLAPSLIDATPKLLANGRTTFLVEWFAGDQQLRGTGSLGLSSDHPNAQTLWTLEDHLEEAREWAQIEFGSPEDGLELADVLLYANGEPVRNLEIEIVQPDAIHHVEIIGRDESAGAEEELLAVLAQAFDSNGESIWGVSFGWDLDGLSESGEGDLFRYWYEPGAMSKLGAEYGESRAEITIMGDRGYVVSSNESPVDSACFCSSADQRSPGRGIGLGLLSLLALGLVRRRRAS